MDQIRNSKFEIRNSKFEVCGFEFGAGGKQFVILSEAKDLKLRDWAVRLHRCVSG
jgi:hypothetical protein